MILFLRLAFLFSVGSLAGWVLELFYRRLVSSKQWINPGFLVGPYVPLYGFGVCTFYLLAQIPLNGIAVVIIMALTVTLIEYIAGIIFIKGMGVKLWDYSDRWGNIDGLICPLYTVLWGILGAMYYYLANPFVKTSLAWLQDNLAFSFVIGLFFGIFIIDFAYSSQLVVKIRKFAKEKGLIVLYEDFKSTIFNQMKLNKEKYSFIFAISNNVKNIEEHLNAYKEAQIERTHEIKRTIHLFIRNKVKPKNKKINAKEKN